MLKLISFGIIKKISIRKLLSYDTKFKIRAKKPYSVTYKMYKPLYLIYSGFIVDIPTFKHYKYTNVIERDNICNMHELETKIITTRPTMIFDPIPVK